MANHDTECPLCGSAATRYFSLAHAVVWKCAAADCTLQFAHPQLNEQDLARAYTDLYYPDEKKRHEVRFENTPDAVLRQAFHQLETRFGNLRGLRLLDYGCGRGSSLRIALECGLQVTGIESDPEARTAAASIARASVYASVDHLRREGLDGAFDLIVLWTVIEHLRAPWVDLAQLRGLLRPNGRLIISTMDVHCARARMEGRRWENYENPTHLYYFGNVSLARTIQKAGFADCSEWRLKLRYPGHGPVRRWIYEISHLLGFSDGLFYVCSGNSDLMVTSTANATNDISKQWPNAGQDTLTAPRSCRQSRS